MIQALLSRSDRRLAPVIAAARGRHESLGGWKQAYRAVREGEASGSEPLPPAWEDVIHACWSTERVLPWEHLEGPLPQSTLVKHQQDALA
jgi:hypothetical protein